MTLLTELAVEVVNDMRAVIRTDADGKDSVVVPLVETERKSLVMLQ